MTDQEQRNNFNDRFDQIAARKYSATDLNYDLCHGLIEHKNGWKLRSMMVAVNLYDLNDLRSGLDNKNIENAEADSLYEQICGL